MCSLGDKIQGSESICQTALPHLILSDAHSTSVGYSFPTAVANLCVTRDIFAGKYFSCNYIELTKQWFFLFFLLSRLRLPKSYQKLCSFNKRDS